MDRRQEDRSESVRRTLSSIEDRLPQAPQESELLLVRALRRSLSSQSSPAATPCRKSVIEKTPPISPNHWLSPREPARTPHRASGPSNFSSGDNSIDKLTSGAALIYNRGSKEDLVAAESSNHQATNQETVIRSTSLKTTPSIRLSGEYFVFPEVHDTADKPVNRNKMSDHPSILDELDDIEHEIEYLYRNFPASNLDEISIEQDYLDTLASLNELVKKFSKNLRSLTSRHADSVGADVLNSWKEKLGKAESDLGMYRREVRRRLSDLKQQNSGQAIQTNVGSHVRSSLPDASTNHTPVSPSPLEISAIIQNQRSYEEAKAAKESRVALESAKSSINSINQDLEELNKDYSENLIWADADDADIEKAMRNLKSWKEKMSKAKKDSIELEGKVLGEELALTDELSRLKLRVKNTEKELDENIKLIREADEEKGLYCDRSKRSTPLQFPLFSGSPGEDFVEFQTKFEKAVEANRIPKSDQLEKLREVLRGKAKAQVPQKTDTVDRAWELLKSAFGDPMTLLKFRKQALSKLGPFPDASSRTNPQKVVEWCLDVERILDDLLKLGERESRLEMVAFNDDTLNEIIDLFPIRLIFKMERLETEGKEKLGEIQELVEEERKVFQRMSVRSCNQGKRQGGKSEEASNQKPGNAHRVSTVQPKGISLFNLPRKMPNCRVCKELEKRGDNHELYEAHQGNYATHCPRWAAMTTDERSEIAKAAKFCLLCMDPKVTYNPGNSTKHKCITNATKNRFSCSFSRCCFHSWVCTRHKQENKDLMERFSQELQKRKMTFSYIASISPILEVCSSLPNTPEGILDLALPANNRSGSKVTDPDANLHKAIEKLRNLTPKGEHLVTELKDPPLFMFSTISGRFSDVQVFYDSGNSHVLFKEGTPENLYGVKTRAGPFPLGAVGDTTVWGGDEWACQPMTTRGHREVLVGLSVPKITSNFPRVSLKAATADLKASDPMNEELQNLGVPDYVGGECHVLLGIQYAAHFPRLVHSLPSGLGIYEVKLQPNSPRHTAAIAGPHKSFNLLTGKVGNVAFLLQKFKEGIDYWKVNGAPSPKSLEMTEDEKHLALWLNRSELANYESADVDDMVPSIKSVQRIPQKDLSTPPPCLVELSEPLTIAPSKKPMVSRRPRILTVTRDDFLEHAHPRLLTDTRDDLLDTSLPTECFACQEPSEVVLDHFPSGESICILNTLHKDSFTVTTQENSDLTTLKHFISSHESPLKIEYRCPKCRSCGSCRDAVDTEKISLREEAEDAEIKDSVKLDFKNRSFICKLPLRGKIDDFLSTNQHTAEKVLVKQCQLYSKDVAVTQMILQAMNKLFDRGHVCFLKDLSESQQNMINSKSVKYFIPWRCVFKKGSISTPVRPVFDCSARTPRKLDGSGGRCLNDIMCKGRTMSFNLIKMLLRFVVGRYALSGDLRQFYNCFKLIEDHWHLQLFLWKPDMNPNADSMVCVIKTLIYGNKASAPQSEEGIRQLAKHIESSNPKLADFLLECRFVDDLNTSEASKDDCDTLQKDADRELGLLGVESKGWGKSGERPSDEIAEDGCMGVAGMTWCPELDSLEVKLGKLHFGSISRGRLAPGTELFDGKFGTLEELDNFVPMKLTKRMIVSKFMGIFDLLGKLIPLTARFKRDLRKMLRTTPSWDEAVTNEHRTAWVKNFHDLERVKGLKFVRPRMPIDAQDTKMRLMVFVDAAAELLVVWAGVGFKRTNGEWSMSYLIGRCLLASAGTIPRDEMEVLVAGSNMMWLLRKILPGWIDEFLLAGDAQIPLFWTLSEKKRLGLWHRTRSVQIRRGTPLENLFHVRTENNIADGPTRPDKFCLTDVGPGSVWEVGLPWMTKDMEDIINAGILTSVKDLVMKEEDEKAYDEGFVLEKTPDVLTQGHYAASFSQPVNEERIGLVKKRVIFSNYLLLPTRFPFKKTLRIMALVVKFCHKFRCKWSPGYKNRRNSDDQKFQVYATTFSGETISSSNSNSFSSMTQSSGEPFLREQFSALSSYYSKGRTMHVRLEEEDLQGALRYFYLVASKEVEKFVKPEQLSKISVKKNGILFFKSRIIDGQRFLQTGGFEGLDILRSQGINVLTPIIDRWSPLAYSIGEHIHNEVGKHKGFETSFRISHSFVHIMKGLSLFQEIGSECVLCQKSNRHFVQAAMGPIHSSKFTLAPPFWICQCDLWGPMTTYVPGREKNTRNSAALSSKVWALVFVCCITKLTNIQIVESKDAAGICDGLTRLTCEVGTPSKMLVDQESSLIKVLNEGKIEILDLETMIRSKVSMDFSLCAVGGHNAHGLVEAKIKVAQTGFDKSGAGNLRLTATGTQTLAKQIENDMNNTPFGVVLGRSEANTPLLKLLSPNMMRIGRINSRNPIGPFKLPSGPKSLLDRVQDCYKLWFREYQDTLLMKYLTELQPKWFKSDRDLKPGDVVYFRKREGKLEGAWQMGIIDDVTRSSDKIIRRVDIRYHNSNEGASRTTDRSVRGVVKLFNVDEASWKQDMDSIQTLLQQCGINAVVEEVAEPTGQPSSSASLSLSGEPVSASSCLLLDTEKVPNDVAADSELIRPSQCFSGEQVSASSDLLLDTIEVVHKDDNPSEAVHSDAYQLSSPSQCFSGEPVSNGVKLLLDAIEVTGDVARMDNFCSRCCCASHHKLSFHGTRLSDWTAETVLANPEKECIVQQDDMEEISPYLDIVSRQGACYQEEDMFMNCMMSLQTDFDLN